MAGHILQHISCTGDTMKSWLDEMNEQPAFQNSRNYEYQCRRNALIPEALLIADDFAGVEPSRDDLAEYKKWEDKHQRKYHRAMKMLWKQKYGEGA
jgi:hypothetical protein